MSMTALTQYPATRKEAKQKNSKWYFTGDPCKFGHIAPRMTANCGCKVCLYKRREEYENSENYTNWKKNNKQKVANRYIKNNLPKILANTRKYQAAKKNRIPSWISKDELEKIKCLYQVAAMYTKEGINKWHVDHIIPLQGKTVSGLHVFNNLQIIPESKNISKNNKWNWENQSAY